MNNKLYKQLFRFPGKIKLILFGIVVNLTCGVSLGLFYVADTTHLSTIGTKEHFAGSEVNNEFDIPDKYPKPISELLTTTHNHIISLTFVFIISPLIPKITINVIGIDFPITLSKNAWALVESPCTIFQ